MALRENSVNIYTMIHDGEWYYEQLELGYNYRLNDMQAALGISQLKRLDSFVSTRNKIAKRYDESLPTDHLHLPKINQERCHLFICML